jgi:ADP-L-glycero-D-manno-heptose 6-epimerase
MQTPGAAIRYTSLPDKAAKCIVVTGAAGFIGSCLVRRLNDSGFDDLILVDDFSRADKSPNLEGKKFRMKIHRDDFFDWLQTHPHGIDACYHLGARTDTTEFDYAVHQRLNVDYSMQIWEWCTRERIPLVYASSAATYGDGTLGYSDAHDLPEKLQPLNPYGVSKNEFDKWALAQLNTPPRWYGLKFFNVYGPNEYHKGRMASVIFHAFNQIRERGYVNLFRSHRPDFADGQQLRDFIHVSDVTAVCHWLMGSPSASGLYNLGTGRARSFEDLAKATFAGLDLAPDIRFIDMPEDIRDKYQYFTEADMSKLRTAGYDSPFRTLEDGVEDYVRHYLATGRYC